MAMSTNGRHLMEMMLVVLLVVMLVTMLVMAVAMSGIKIRQEVARGWRGREWLAGHESCWWRQQSGRRVGMPLALLRGLRLSTLLRHKLWLWERTVNDSPSTTICCSGESPTCGVGPPGLRAAPRGPSSFGRYSKINSQITRTVRFNLRICSTCF